MPQVAIHDLAQARAALAAAGDAGVPIELRSAPDAAAYAGVGYLKALAEAVGQEILIDCGEDAGVVMAALRTGCRRLAFTGPPEVAHRLADMAREVGATLVLENDPPDALQLAPEDDAGAQCRAWLEPRRGSR